MIELAMQYYASGRFAAINGMLPVCGNLLHHAVEMFLKGALARRLDRAALYGLKHDLKKIWKRTKLEFPGTELSSFDASIFRLDLFERIRYPDNLVDEGGTIQIDIHRNAWVPSHEDKKTTPRMYNFVLEDIDELVKVIFGFASLNPLFFSGGMKRQAFAMINDSNRHPIFPS